MQSLVDCSEVGLPRRLEAARALLVSSFASLTVRAIAGLRVQYLSNIHRWAALHSYMHGCYRFRDINGL